MKASDDDAAQAPKDSGAFDSIELKVSSADISLPQLHIDDSNSSRSGIVSAHHLDVESLTSATPRQTNLRSFGNSLVDASGRANARCCSAVGPRRHDAEDRAMDGKGR